MSNYTPNPFITQPAHLPLLRPNSESTTQWFLYFLIPLIVYLYGCMYVIPSILSLNLRLSLYISRSN